MDELNVTIPTILCVDDHVEACPLIEALLPDYRIIEAHHALTALQLTSTDPFDLFVLDLRLPDMDGITLCREIRRHDPNTPIIFCSGSDQPSDRDRAVDAGASAYLIKPVDPVELTKQAARLLNESEHKSAVALQAAMGAVGIGEWDSAKKRAYAAYSAAGGSRAYFERNWPNLGAANPGR